MAVSAIEISGFSEGLTCVAEKCKMLVENLQVPITIGVAGGSASGKTIFAKKLIEQFGSHENWEKDFKAVGSMRGIGWAILYYDSTVGRLFNIWIDEHDMGHVAGCQPLLVLDVFEHAYVLDYGIKRAGYIEAFFNAINWEEVTRRFGAAMKK